MYGWRDISPESIFVILHECQLQDGNSIANIFQLLALLLHVTQTPRYGIFTSLEVVVHQLLQGFFLVDEAVIQKVDDLRQELETLRHALCMLGWVESCRAMAPLSTLWQVGYNNAGYIELNLILPYQECIIKHF